jgi:dTDP-4-dehydrorhamnose 3,5-epimerase
MTLNLIVPIGEIKFVLFDDRKSSKTYNEFFEIELSYNNYCRLTIPPGIWVSFVGIGKGQNILLNIGNLEHDPNEADTLLINNNIIPYTWI